MDNPVKTCGKDRGDAVDILKENGEKRDKQMCLVEKGWIFSPVFPQCLKPLKRLLIKGSGSFPQFPQDLLLRPFKSLKTAFRSVLKRAKWAFEPSEIQC